MVPNVPVSMRVKFVDVYANDTSKNNGKGYGSQVAVKGEIGGETFTIYLKGFTNENVGQLVDAGVIAPNHYPHDPAEKYNIPVVGKDAVTLCLEQLAGMKYPKMRITGANGSTSVPSPRSTAPVASAMTPVKPAYVQQDVGRLPGEENPFDEMVEKYAECVSAANSSWGINTIKDEALVAAAATLFIERNRKGI